MVVALAAGVCLLAAPPGQVPRSNLLLVTLDTVRADRLGSYGYSLASTPALDRLAREGVRFADATSQSPLTTPAHGALLTGTYPARFGLRDNGASALPAEAQTLGEALKAAGYQTAGFVAAFILDRAYGFDQGLDHFDSRFDRFESGDKLKAERTAEQVVGPALEWIRRVPADQPFFAWVHFYDAHAPYSPPGPTGTRFRQRPYDGEIAYVDQAVARLVSLLEQRSLLERTVVVAVGDHGESLGEHGEEDHGLFLYDATLAVPWIVRLPGRAHAGTVVREQVRSVDVMPTLLDALGVKPAPGLDGESVMGVVRGKPRPAPPLSYAETFYPKLHFGWSELRSARVGEWKLVDAPRPELYDLRVDKRETANAYARQAGVAGRLFADLRGVADSLSGAVRPAAVPPDAETLERLRSLGYVGFSAPAASGGRGADPKDMAPKLRDFRRLMTEATDLLRRGQAGGAVARLKQALAINDRAYDVHLALGDAYLQQRQLEQALGEYEAAALLHPTVADPLLAAARVLGTQGRFDRAVQKTDQAARLEPLSAEIPLARGWLSEQQGLQGEALSQYQAAVAANPSYARARARLADSAMRLRQWDLAGEQFAALLAAGYQPSRSHYGLGRVAEAKGDRARALQEYRKALALEPGFAEAKEAVARVSGGGR